MKKTFTFALFALMIASAIPAFAAVKANVSLAEDGDKLWANARLTGIESGQTVTVTFRWTAPLVEYTTKKGKKVRLFSDTTLTCSRPLGDADGPCVCSDTGEKGCQRTRAYRTLVTTLSNGTEVRAAGTWHVDVLIGFGTKDEYLIGQATYEIK
jgi:Tfp pilus assembly protein FimT